jgi:hypothetical protein
MRMTASGCRKQSRSSTSFFMAPPGTDRAESSTTV